MYNGTVGLVNSTVMCLGILVSSDDWYRNKEWSDEIEENFYSKLKRARSQRDQYMVIQALSLTDTYPEVALRLVEEYFDSRTNPFDDVRALLARANAYISLEDFNNAIAAYRAILARENELPNHQTGAYLDYPYLVATQQIKGEYENAVNVLNEHAGRLALPLDYFKWYASFALINQDGSYASKALDAAKVKRSGFRFHQVIGLVGKKYEKTIKQLCKIST
jgi:tetratricopeptide (TPR) repeat protein